jgi:hypothetical protein
MSKWTNKIATVRKLPMMKLAKHRGWSAVVILAAVAAMALTEAAQARMGGGFGEGHLSGDRPPITAGPNRSFTPRPEAGRRNMTCVKKCTRAIQTREGRRCIDAIVVCHAYGSGEGLVDIR